MGSQPIFYFANGNFIYIYRLHLNWEIKWDLHPHRKNLLPVFPSPKCGIHMPPAGCNPWLVLPMFLAQLGPKTAGTPSPEITALLCHGLCLESAQSSNEMCCAWEVTIDTMSTSSVRCWNLGVSEEEEFSRVAYWTSGRAGSASISGAPLTALAVLQHRFINAYFIWQTGGLRTLAHTLQIISPKPSQPMKAFSIRLRLFFLLKGIGIKLLNFGPKPPTPWLCSTSYFTDLLHTTLQQ